MLKHLVRGECDRYVDAQRPVTTLERGLMPLLPLPLLLVHGLTH